MHGPGRLWAALLFTLLPAAAAADWVRVETPNFIVYGETGEKRLREVAGEFERFREALPRVIPGTNVPAAVPTVVVVFDSQKAFAPYRPRFNGKPVELGGYFYASEDMNIVAFADVDRDQSLRTIFHEYLHLAAANVSQGMPLWLSEGLAEYYSTFQVLDGGRRAIVGRLIPSHLRLLNQRRLMKIEDLLTVDTRSSEYNERTRQSLFYAQSWALVHMLVSDADGRTALSAYAKLMAAGRSSREAWTQAIGDSDMDRRLGRYVAQETMTGLSFQFDREIPKVRSDARAVSAGDAEATLADLLRRVAPAAETSARFEAAIALQPPSARARALYGLHALQQGEKKRARALLTEAARDRSDWLVQYHVATGLTRLAVESSDAEPSVFDLAREVLQQVLSARPELPHALAMSARLDALAEGDFGAALATLRRARALAPGREDYILVEAYILARQGEFSQSRQLLTALQASVYPAHIRNNAGELLQQVDRGEREMAEYRARLEGRRNHARGASDNGPPAGAAPTSVPVYRRVEAGEQRIEGRLDRIACSASGITLHVVTGNGTLERFEAASMDRIDFISYRSDLQGAITCGPRTPADLVYVTWRGDISRRVLVAVEFLAERPSR